MCYVCEAGVKFKVGDRVIVNLTHELGTGEWVSEQVLREVVEVCGTLKVRIGRSSNLTYEWIWPIDVEAVIRDGYYYTMETLIRAARRNTKNTNMTQNCHPTGRRYDSSQVQ